MYLEKNTFKSNSPTGSIPRNPKNLKVQESYSYKKERKRTLEMSILKQKYHPTKDLPLSFQEIHFQENPTFLPKKKRKC